MKKRLVTLDDDLANLLAKQPNASETVRTALKVYLGYISPDGKPNLVGILTDINKSLQDVRERSDELDWRITEVKELMDKIVSRMDGYS